MNSAMTSPDLLAPPAAAAAVWLDPEFWKLLLTFFTVALSPVLHHLLLTKFTPATVHLFTACLPLVPVLTYRANLGIVHLLYTPLLMAAALAMCASLTALGRLACQFVHGCVASVVHFAWGCVEFVGRAIRHLVVSVFCSVGRALVATGSLVMSFRFRLAAIGVAASLVFPPMGVALLAVVALWIAYLLVRGICFVLNGILAVVGAVCAYVGTVITTVKDAVVGKLHAMARVVGRAMSALAFLLGRILSLVLRTLYFLITLLLIAAVVAEPTVELLVGVLAIKALMAGIVVKVASVVP
jgi:hypothetical protein